MSDMKYNFYPEAKTYISHCQQILYQPFCSALKDIVLGPNASTQHIWSNMNDSGPIFFLHTTLSLGKGRYQNQKAWSTSTEAFSFSFKVDKTSENWT